MSRRERKLLRRKGKKYGQEEENSISEQTSEETEQKETVKETHKHEHVSHEYGPGLKGKIISWYERTYKQQLVFSAILLLVALIIVIGNIVLTGDFIQKGISLKGGITLTVTSDQMVDIDEFQSYLQSQLPKGDIGVRELSQSGVAIGFIVDAADVPEADLLKAVESKIGTLEKGKYSMEQMGSSLGESFFRETILALVVAFLFMSLVVTIYFRLFVPSMAVILSAFADIVCTIAVVDIIGMKISTAGIAAFLMLIGYSVDTDILLSTRVLKRQEGTVFQRVIDAFGTGMAMTGTTLAAIVVVLIFTQSEVLRQIMYILLIGLIFDIINTWIQNAAILRWYAEKHPEKLEKMKSN